MTDSNQLEIQHTKTKTEARGKFRGYPIEYLVTTTSTKKRTAEGEITIIVDDGYYLDADVIDQLGENHPQAGSQIFRQPLQLYSHLRFTLGWEEDGELTICNLYQNSTCSGFAEILQLQHVFNSFGKRKGSYQFDGPPIGSLKHDILYSGIKSIPELTQSELLGLISALKV